MDITSPLNPANQASPFNPLNPINPNSPVYLFNTGANSECVAGPQEDCQMSEAEGLFVIGILAFFAVGLIALGMWATRELK